MANPACAPRATTRSPPGFALPLNEAWPRQVKESDRMWFVKRFVRCLIIHGSAQKSTN